MSTNYSKPIATTAQGATENAEPVDTPASSEIANA
jgi:hypothetical protein